MQTSSIPTPYSAAAARSVAVPFPLTALQKLLLPVGAVLFDGLFWHERMALNMLIYTLLVVGGVGAGLPRHAPQWRSGYFWLDAAGHAAERGAGGRLRLRCRTAGGGGVAGGVAGLR